MTGSVYAVTGSGVPIDCRCPRALHRHGTRAMHTTHGCRCFHCRLANSQAKTTYAQGGTWSEQRVPTVGIVRRMQALNRIGWTWEALGRELGVPRQEAKNRAGGRSRKYAFANTAAEVADLYARLSNIVPEGVAAHRARLSAERKGYLPPIAWDDSNIDDPDAQPYESVPVGLDEIAVELIIAGTLRVPGQAGSRKLREQYGPELIEAVRRMAGWGYSDTVIGRRVHRSPDAVLKLRERNSIPAGVPKSRKKAA